MKDLLRYKNSLFTTLLVATLLLSSGCGNVNYSFTGADIPAQASSFSVKYFQTVAPLASPTISQSFTEALKDILIAQTPLDLAQKTGDLQYEGSIVGYDLSPVAIQGNNDEAAFTRLTVTVRVKFTNTISPEKNSEKNYSRYADFESAQSLSSVEETLITEINDQLVQDVFNGTLGSW